MHLGRLALAGALTTWAACSVDTFSSDDSGSSDATEDASQSDASMDAGGGKDAPMGPPFFCGPTMQCQQGTYCVVENTIGVNDGGAVKPSYSCDPFPADACMPLTCPCLAFHTGVGCGECVEDAGDYTVTCAVN